MINRRKKGSSLWRKPANLTEMKSSVNDVFDVADLKTVTKRISIISRLQQKTIRSNHHNYKTNSSNSYFKQDVCPKGNESKSMKRPQTSNTGKICSMNLAQKAYKVEKRINDKLIGENYHSENRDKKNNVA